MAGLFDSFSALRRKQNMTSRRPAVRPMTRPVDRPVERPVAQTVEAAPSQPTTTVISEKLETKAKMDFMPTAAPKTTAQTTSAVEGEDYLLAQIDEFRVKAEQLQALLRNKEEKAKELQRVVTERERKVEALSELVAERQVRADGFTKAVEAKLDELMDQVDNKLDAVGATVAKELEEGRAAEEARLAEIQEQFMQELATVKADLSEKIHTENVQSYRNMSELVKNVEQRLDKMEELDGKLKSLKSMATTLIVFAVLNFGGVAFLILMKLGLLPF